MLNLLIILVFILFAGFLFLRWQSSVRQLNIARAELARANADLSRLADVSAHHLMEPVRRLSSYAQLLRAQIAALPALASETEIESSLSFIEQSAEGLRSLVHDVQLYLAAGLPRGKQQTTDSNALLAGLKARLAQQLLAQNTTLEIGDLPAASLDRGRFSELWFILLDNALCHGSPPDSAKAAQIRISGERVSGLSRFRLCDNGKGVPEPYLERVFEIFERLNTSHDAGGTGIGLAIARRMVESRGGKIWLENLPAGGLMVVFELPDGVAMP